MYIIINMLLGETLKQFSIYLHYNCISVVNLSNLSNKGWRFSSTLLKIYDNSSEILTVHLTNVE